MKSFNEDLFGAAISIEQLEPRLELAAAKKTSVGGSVSEGPGGCTVTVTCTITF